ncbi:MAG TPA: hypothetical protein VMA83_00325 [Solirubrobacteraceae bacterium]|nr:hypothetical protein [Solirubrobacteraceae bacterium]
MRDRRRQFTAVLALAAALIAALTLTRGQRTLYSLTTVADRTARVTGAHLAIQTTLSGLQSLSMTGSGTVNFRRGESAIAMQLDGLPSSTQPPGGGPVEMFERETGGAVYVRSPLASSTLPGNARWIKVDVASLRGVLGVDPASTGESGIDPSSYLQYLQTHGARFSLAGTQAIRGVSTKHYVGSFDLLTELEPSLKAMPDQIRNAVSRTLTNADSVPIQVWVDGSGLIRREQISLELDAGRPLTTTTTVELFDFGPTPRVVPPPADETYDATGLVRSAFASDSV